MLKLHHKSPTVSVVVWWVHFQLVYCPSRPSIHHYHSHHLHQTLHELNTTVHIHIHHMATKYSPHVCCCMHTAFWCQMLNFCHIAVLVMSCYTSLDSEAQATSIGLNTQWATGKCNTMCPLPRPGSSVKNNGSGLFCLTIHLILVVCSVVIVVSAIPCSVAGSFHHGIQPS